MSPHSRDLAKSAGIYGLTEDLLLNLIEVQSGLCAICKRSLSISFHIDHDHSCCEFLPGCGQCVRGLLCGPCNAGLGMLGDTFENLHKAARYLERYENKRADFIKIFKTGLNAERDRRDAVRLVQQIHGEGVVA